MREEETPFNSFLGRGINLCHCLSSISNANESKNANVVALLENKPMNYAKTQNEKAQRKNMKRCLTCAIRRLNICNL